MDLYNIYRDNIEKM